MRFAKPILSLAALLAAAVLGQDNQGWIVIFDGKTLNGWKANESPENWTVVDGMLSGHGTKSHLFYMKHECVDCEFQAEIKLAKNSNSGMYFRTQFGPGFPNGYEAQVNNSHTDPVRTGSLYNMVKIYDPLVADDTWWTQRIRAVGQHIEIWVNDKKTVDYFDENNTHSKGYLALQQHDPGSSVFYRNLKMRIIKSK